MKRKIIVCFVSVTVLALGALCVAAKIDFSGTWLLDKSKSEGLPPGLDQTMTVTQAAERVDIETKLVGAQGEQIIKDTYILNGKETEFVPPVLGGNKAKTGKRTSTRAADDNGFDVREEAVIEGPEGGAKIKATRRWMLSTDGKILTIVMSFDGPNGVTNTKRVFVRK
jgi:hypothetical protein